MVHPLTPLAATYIAARLGLTTDLDAVDARVDGVRRSHQPEPFDLYQLTGDRPVAVLDDELGGRDPNNALPHQVQRPDPARPVDPRTPLRRDDIHTALTWLGDLVGHHDRPTAT